MTSSIKLVVNQDWGQDIRRVALGEKHVSELTLDFVREKVKERFPDQNVDQTILQYLDDEGDMVMMANDEDLKNAFQMHDGKSLKIFVRNTSSPMHRCHRHPFGRRSFERCAERLRRRRLHMHHRFGHHHEHNPLFEENADPNEDSEPKEDVEPRRCRRRHMHHRFGHRHEHNPFFEENADPNEDPEPKEDVEPRRCRRRYMHHRFGHRHEHNPLFEENADPNEDSEPKEDVEPRRCGLELLYRLGSRPRFLQPLNQPKEEQPEENNEAEFDPSTGYETFTANRANILDRSPQKLRILLSCIEVRQPSDMNKVYALLTSQARTFTENEDHDRSAVVWTILSELFPTNPMVWYQLASAQMHMALLLESQTSLTLAIDTGFNDVLALAKNETLGPIRSTPVFVKLMKKALKASPHVEKTLHQLNNFGIRLLKTDPHYAHTIFQVVDEPIVEGWYVGAYNLACANARLGRTDEALAALNRAVDIGFNDRHILADEDLESIRNTPEFNRIVSEMFNGRDSSEDVSRLQREFVHLGPK